MLYALVRVVLGHPIHAAWLRVASFGGLERWAAGVEGCTMEGEGPGTIRTVSLAGRVVRERLEAVDTEGHRLRYHILPLHSVLVRNVYAEMILTALDGGGMEVLWRSEATDFTVPPEQVGARIEQFYLASIEGLARLLDAS